MIQALYFIEDQNFLQSEINTFVIKVSSDSTVEPHAPKNFAYVKFWNP